MIEFKCEECDWEYYPQIDGMECPNCGSDNVKDTTPEDDEDQEFGWLIPY